MAWKMIKAWKIKIIYAMENQDMVFCLLTWYFASSEFLGVRVNFSLYVCMKSAQTRLQAASKAPTT